MKLPFSKELDETFRSDRSAWIKMAGGAFVAGFLLVVMIGKTSTAEDPSGEILRPLNLGMLAFSAVAGAVLALMLSMKDVIRRRMDRGDSVNFLLKLYLGMGIWSLVAWFPTLFLLGIALIIATH